MDLNSADFLKLNPNQRDEVRKIIGFKNEREFNEAIDMFVEWIRKQNHFVCKDFDRNYLAAFLIGAKGSIEKAKARLDKRCTFSTLMPELFDNIKPDVDFDNLHCAVKHFTTPMPTEDNYRMIFDKFIEDEVDKFDLMEYVKYAILCSEYFLNCDCSMGYVLVLDMSNIKTTSIILKLSPVLMQKASIVLVDGYGHRVKHIHLVNSSKFVDTLVSVLKQGVSAKIANRIVVHKSSDTLKDYVPLVCLPKEYGGSSGTISECHAATTKEMKSSRSLKYLKRAENFKTDEGKRLSGKFNEEYMGTPGSFRSLSVD